MQITREYIDERFLEILGISIGEISFESIWNHFVDRGDFKNLTILDTKPVYNKNGYHIEPIPLVIEEKSITYDLFYTETDIPQEFKKRIGTTYYITGKTRFLDDRPSSDLIVYGKRKNKNGQWSKISNQLIVYKIKAREEED
jgi:hypothetical protein